jgi:hypothetical protein
MPFLSHLLSNKKLFFQSFFMLTISHPFALAASSDASNKRCPFWAQRQPVHHVTGDWLQCEV